MPDALNAYGDRLVATTGRHGADIASQRVDALDRRALAAVLDAQTGAATARPVCVEYGSGLGWQGARMALLGASVRMIDQLPAPPLALRLAGVDGVALEYLQADLRTLRPSDLPPRVDVAFSQRTLHYLPHDDATRLVATTARALAPGGRFYVSVSGLGSELGQGYAHADRPLGARYAPLAPALRERHGIAEAVCLYDEADLRALMEGAGLVTLELWRSAFGNLKGVFGAPR